MVPMRRRPLLPGTMSSEGLSSRYSRTILKTRPPMASAICTPRCGLWHRPASHTPCRSSATNPGGEFVERHWQPINTPIHDKDGHLIFLLHHVEDVTAQVLPPAPEKPAGSGQNPTLETRWS